MFLAFIRPMKSEVVWKSWRRIQSHTKALISPTTGKPFSYTTYETENFESFICKIAATYAEEAVLTADGKIDYRALKPVLFEMPTYEYLKTGEILGKCMSFGKTEWA